MCLACHAQLPGRLSERRLRPAAHFTSVKQASTTWYVHVCSKEWANPSPFFLKEKRTRNNKQAGSTRNRKLGLANGLNTALVAYRGSPNNKVEARAGQPATSPGNSAAVLHNERKIVPVNILYFIPIPLFLPYTIAHRFNVSSCSPSEPESSKRRNSSVSILTRY